MDHYHIMGYIYPFLGVLCIQCERDVKGRSAWAWGNYGLLSRFILIAIVVSVSVSGGHTFNTFTLMSDNDYIAFHPHLATISAILVALGIAFAIWARVHLGRNWSSYPSLKENHELVTSGPYKIVRHPIYTGLLVAIIGSGIEGGVWWILVFVIASAVFVRRVFKEEKIMTREFPNKYPDYKKHTWALIPFIF